MTITFSGEKNITLDGTKHVISRNFLQNVAKIPSASIDADLDAGLDFPKIARKWANSEAAKTKPSGFVQLTEPQKTELRKSDVEKYIAYLEAEQAFLKQDFAVRLAAGQTSQALSLKVSHKGALSVYGMGRFPVTLYREQWEKLIKAIDQIRTFLDAPVDTIYTGEYTDPETKVKSKYSTTFKFKSDDK
jgi:hypothetical protein